MPAPRRPAWWLLAAAVWAQMTISVAEMGVPTIAPYLEEAFGLSSAGVGLLVATINLGRIAGSIPAGRAVDRVGEHAVMAIGGVGVALFFGVGALVSGPVALGAALVLAGVFAGSATPAGAKLVLGAFPPERRGLPMGIRQSAVPLGTLIAALVLPPIARSAGVGAALAIGGLVPFAGTVGLLLAGRRLRVPRRRPAVRPGARPPLGELARNRGIVLATGWAVIFVGGQYAIASYLVLDLTEDSHLSLAKASLMLPVASAAGVAGRVLWGLAGDAVWGGRRRPPMLALTFVGTAAAALLAVLPALPATFLAVTAAAIAGLSMLSWQGLWTSVVSELVPAASAGTALGFGLTFVNAGIVVWPPLFGLLADLSGGFRLSWAVLAGALACSSALLLAMPEPRGTALSDGDRNVEQLAPVPERHGSVATAPRTPG